MTDGILAAAAQLLEHGLPGSALSLLDSVEKTDRHYNRLRAIAAARIGRQSLAPGIYTLVAVENIGLVLPVSAYVGTKRPVSFEPDASAAVDTAEKAAKSLFETVSNLPRLTLSTPDLISVYGKSIGLAAALAFVAKLLGKTPSRPILVTGEIGAEGRVLPVDGTAQKLQAASLEIGTGPQDAQAPEASALVIIPEERNSLVGSDVNIRRVSTFAGAVQIVFGTGPYSAASALSDMLTVLEQSRREADHRKAVDLLESIPKESLPDADRAALLLDLGVRRRHLGDVGAAEKAHNEVRQLLPEITSLLGRDIIETMQIETLRTMMSNGMFDYVEPVLRERIAGDLLLVHNRVRCQGMLAELLSTACRHEEVLSLREANLKLQQLSEAMRREIPRTLAAMVWEAARAGNTEAFDKYAQQLFEQTSPGDEHQQRYNDAALVRGMVRLERYDFLDDWLSNRSLLFDHSPGTGLRRILEGTSPIDTYPEVSTAGALIRLHLNRGRPEAAASIAERIKTSYEEPMLRQLAISAREAAEKEQADSYY